MFPDASTGDTKVKEIQRKAEVHAYEYAQLLEACANYECLNSIQYDKITGLDILKKYQFVKEEMKEGVRGGERKERKTRLQNYDSQLQRTISDRFGKGHT